MSAPKHAGEHNDIAMMIGKVVDNSKFFNMWVLVTVGHDGRPCIGSNLPPHITHELLKYLGSCEDQVESVDVVDMPKDN